MPIILDKKKFLILWYKLFNTKNWTKFWILGTLYKFPTVAGPFLKYPTVQVGFYLVLSEESEVSGSNLVSSGLIYSL